LTSPVAIGIPTDAGSERSSGRRAFSSCPTSRAEHLPRAHRAGTTDRGNAQPAGVQRL